MNEHRTRKEENYFHVEDEWKAGIKKFPLSIYFIQDLDAFNIDTIAVLHNKQDVFDQLSGRQ